MPQKYMPEADRKTRIAAMQQEAAEVTESNYQKPLTQEELDEKREQLSENLITLSEKEDELNEIKDRFKTEMKPLKEKNKELLSEIKTKQSTVYGQLYNIPNHEDGMMETYDTEGELISTRRLKPSEKQGRLFIAKTGTED